jgi:integrase
MASGKLTTRRVETAKAGRHGDGAGLWLVVSPAGAKRWCYRFTIAGRVSETGLGSFPAVSLAAAREAAAAARRAHKAGVNPIAAKRAAEIQQAAKPTFGAMADALIASKGPAWRNPKHRQQWVSTLRDYCEAIRAMAVDEIETAHVLQVLTPIWQVKSETASRLRGRIEAVLDAARAQGHRAGENPAAWRGHLAHILPKRPKLARGHHAALPYEQVPAFIARLREREGLAALALEFTILTAARSGEVLGSRWEEFDLAGKVWTVPAARMKAGQAHRVPLSSRALEILETLAKAKTGPLVFEGFRNGRPLSGMAMAMLLRRMGVENVTTHGFRSSFRDWAGETTSFPRDICESALAHTLQGVEAAYRRGDALEKRRALMQSWADYCEPETGANVVSITKSGRKAR